MYRYMKVHMMGTHCSASGDVLLWGHPSTLVVTNCPPASNMQSSKRGYSRLDGSSSRKQATEGRRCHTLAPTRSMSLARQRGKDLRRGITSKTTLNILTATHCMHRPNLLKPWSAFLAVNIQQGLCFTDYVCRLQSGECSM